MGHGGQRPTDTGRDPRGQGRGSLHAAETAPQTAAWPLQPRIPTPENERVRQLGLHTLAAASPAIAPRWQEPQAPAAGEQAGLAPARPTADTGRNLVSRFCAKQPEGGRAAGHTLSHAQGQSGAEAPAGRRAGRRRGPWVPGARDSECAGDVAARRTRAERLGHARFPSAEAPGRPPSPLACRG